MFSTRFALSSLLTVLFAVLSVALPTPAGSSSSAKAGISLVPQVKYWSLPTGSRIAYVHVAGSSKTRRPPVIFLHGGPGAYIVDLAAPGMKFFFDLAEAGFDIYLYDQVGSGRSARLADPREYTVDRHIADLEAIRKQIGTEQLILIGDSWGATLAANYMAAHPGRCAKTIFTSPGAIDPREGPRMPVYELAYVSLREREWVRLVDGQPRYRELFRMINHDPVAAHRYASDAEMDKLNDELIQRLVPGLVCDAKNASKWSHVEGTGWWVNTMIGRDLWHRRTHPIPALRKDPTPVLVLRGACDYLKWNIASQYKSVFPNATLLWIPGAGHGIVFDRPELYKSAVRSFLLGERLPLPAHTSGTPPACDVSYSGGDLPKSARREDCVN